MNGNQTPQTDGDSLMAAYGLVLHDLANWRHEALADAREYGERDRLLLKVQQIAEETCHRLTGSYI